MLGKLAPGDVVTVTRIDRLARSTFDLFAIVKRIADAKAQFRSLAEPWADTGTSTGRLMLAVLGGLADVERDLIRTRTAEGRSRAKAQGKHMGRPSALTPSQKKKEAIWRRSQGATLDELARSYNVSRATISRLTVTALAGTGAAAAYAIFRIFTTKWIDHRFSERLEAFKHQQNQEIEHLRFRINTMMDWNVKLHQREFDVSPETWSLLTEAFNTIEPIALGFQQYPDLNKMSSERLDEFLDQSPLAGSQKAELKGATDKVRYYRDVKAGHDLNRAIDTYNDFHRTFSKNAIFIIEPLKEKFASIDNMLKQAIMERQVQPHKFDIGVTLHEKGRALLKTLERDVQGRLWSSQDTKE
jgi:hypothetical protein